MPSSSSDWWFDAHSLVSTKLLSRVLASCIDSNCTPQFSSLGSSRDAFPCWKMGGADIPSLQNTETIFALALLPGKLQPSVLASWEWVTAAGTQRCHTLLCSIQQQLPLPALCHISWPQWAVHVAQEEALPAAGWAEAMPGPASTETERAPSHIFLKQSPTNTYCNLQLSAPNITNVQSQPDEHLKGEHGLLSSLTCSKKDFIFRDHC